MKLILRYVRPYRWFIAAVMLIKLIGTGTDLPSQLLCPSLNVYVRSGSLH